MAQEKVDAVLVSLDAKKAFDSVDHGYIERKLKKYGFEPNFIKYIKTLYAKLTAKLLINGNGSKIIWYPAHKSVDYYMTLPKRVSELVTSGIVYVLLLITLLVENVMNFM